LTSNPEIARGPRQMAAPALAAPYTPVQGSIGNVIAVVPLLLSVPLMYWPKLLDGDTQPWVVVGAAIAFMFYWPRRQGAMPKNRLLWMSALAAVSVGAYAIRGPEIENLVRYGAVVATFIMLWHVGSRGVPSAFTTAVRIAILVWFVVGLFQTVAIRLGIPIEFIGRYTPGRSGVPSLTAEASFYGSISVLHLMYLLGDNNRWNRPFCVLAVANVLMSGSTLSFLLLLIPAARLKREYMILAILGVAVIFVLGLDFSQSGFFNRLQSFDPGSIGTRILETDPSTNYRFGNILFAFGSNLWHEVTFQSSVDFYLDYNTWAAGSRLFLFVDSDFIVTSGGELAYRSGLFGIAIIVLALKTAYERASTFTDKVEKVAFVVACMLNPVSFANPVFAFFIMKQYQRFDKRRADVG